MCAYRCTCAHAGPVKFSQLKIVDRYGTNRDCVIHDWFETVVLAVNGMFESIFSPEYKNTNLDPFFFYNATVSRDVKREIS